MPARCGVPSSTSSAEFLEATVLIYSLALDPHLEMVTPMADVKALLTEQPKEGLYILPYATFPKRPVNPERNTIICMLVPE